MKNEYSLFNAEGDYVGPPTSSCPYCESGKIKLAHSTVWDSTGKLLREIVSCIVCERAWSHYRKL